MNNTIQLTDENIDDYEKIVDEYFKLDSPIIFGNLKKAHAKHIIKKLFNDAKQNIRIFSGKFDIEFYSDVMEDLKEAAKRINAPAGIKIITVDEKEPEKLLIQFENINKEINEDKNARVIKYLSLINKGKPEDIEHFIVTDNKRYRQEEGHPELTKDTEVKAKVCFNGPIVASDLCNLFDAVWNKYYSAA